MTGNVHSLPHDSKNGHHLDVHVYREGKVKPEKMHETMEGSKVEPTSIEGLRQRLRSQKGY